MLFLNLAGSWAIVLKNNRIGNCWGSDMPENIGRSEYPKFRFRVTRVFGKRHRMIQAKRVWPTSVDDVNFPRSTPKPYPFTDARVEMYRFPFFNKIAVEPDENSDVHYCLASLLPEGLDQKGKEFIGIMECPNSIVKYEQVE